MREINVLFNGQRVVAPIGTSVTELLEAHPHPGEHPGRLSLHPKPRLSKVAVAGTHRRRWRLGELATPTKKGCFHA